MRAETSLLCFFNYFQLRKGCALLLMQHGQSCRAPLPDKSGPTPSAVALPHNMLTHPVKCVSARSALMPVRSLALPSPCTPPLPSLGDLAPHQLVSSTLRSVPGAAATSRLISRSPFGAKSFAKRKPLMRCQERTEGPS